MYITVYFSSRVHKRCGKSAETLRKHCGNCAEKLRKQCGNRAETLRKHCGNIAEKCGNIAETVRKHCGNFAETLRKLCGNIVEKMRKHCGNCVGIAWRLCGTHVRKWRWKLRKFRKTTKMRTPCRAACASICGTCGIIVALFRFCRPPLWKQCLVLMVGARFASLVNLRS